MAAFAEGSPSCESSAEGITEVIDCLASAVHDRLLQQEAVHLAAEVDVLDSHRRRAETLRIRASLVP